MASRTSASFNSRLLPVFRWICGFCIGKASVNEIDIFILITFKYKYFSYFPEKRSYSSRVENFIFLQCCSFCTKKNQWMENWRFFYFDLFIYFPFSLSSFVKKHLRKINSVQVSKTPKLINPIFDSDCYFEKDIFAQFKMTWDMGVRSQLNNHGLFFHTKRKLCFVRHVSQLRSRNRSRKSLSNCRLFKEW